MSLERFVHPQIGAKRVNEITSGDVMRVLLPIWNDKRATATKLKSRIAGVEGAYQRGDGHSSTGGLLKSGVRQPRFWRPPPHPPRTPRLHPPRTQCPLISEEPLLQGSGRTQALRALLQAEQERGPDFLRLANALSALYPRGSDEKQLLDAMLLAAR